MLSTHSLIVYGPVLVGTVAITAIDLARRALSRAGISTPLQLLTAWYVVAASMFWVTYQSIWGMTLPDVLPGFWRAVAMTTLANTFILYTGLRASALAEGEVSLTAPIRAMTPGLLTFMGLVLREFPGKMGWLGMLCLAVGSYVLLWEGVPERWWEYFGPLRRLGQLRRYRHLTSEEQGKTMAVTWAFASATIGTVGLLFDGLYTRRGNGMQGLALGSTVQLTMLAGIYLVWYLVWPDNPDRSKKRSFRGFIAPFSPAYLPLLLVLGAAWVAHVYLINPAFTQTYVAHVGTLKRFSVITTIIVGSLMFGEGSLRQRLWAGTLVVLGAILISMDGLPQRVTTQIEGLGL